MKLMMYPLPVLALMLAGFSCPPNATIELIPESSSARLEFGIVRKNSINGINFGALLVSRCPDQRGKQEIYWHIAAPPNMDIPPTRVRYGVVPIGFDEIVVSKPLTEGCYFASVIRGGIVEFRFSVDRDGVVRHLPITPA